MISEGYVSLEVARLLKEKGFNEQTDYIFYYYEEDDDWCFEKLLAGDVFREEKMLHCPSLAMAMRWLREEKDILISVNPTVDKDGFVCLMYYIWDIDDIEKKTITSGLYSHEGYNECVEAAIRYCLTKLI